jgi:hypothetical protein
MKDNKHIGKKSIVLKRKMKPYIGKNKEGGKYYFNDDTTEKPTYKKKKALKEEISNANRSFKKSARQEGKKEIRNFLSKNIDDTE